MWMYYHQVIELKDSLGLTVLNDKDEVLTQAILYTVLGILKLGSNLKGSEKKGTDRIDQIKPVVKDNLDLQKEDICKIFLT